MIKQIYTKDEKFLWNIRIENVNYKLCNIKEYKYIISIKINLFIIVFFTKEGDIMKNSIYFMALGGGQRVGASCYF